MTEPSYWLDLFTAKTWQEFLDAGASTSGFSASRWTTVRRMKVGDYLLCYLTGISRFIGVIRVDSEPFQSDTPIWGDATFPSRVNVELVHRLDPETAVPVLELRDQLSMFQNLTNPNYWSGAFRGSPALWKSEDGRRVIAAIEEAARNPTERPVDKAKLGRRPKTFRSAIGEVTLPDEETDTGQNVTDASCADPDASAGPSDHTDIQGLLL